MLGSPPKPPRLWPEPPPAHTHGIDRFLYPLDGDREPRLAHVHQPDTYPFTEVEEEVISSNYAQSISSQVRHIFKEEPTKVATKEICPCKPITVWSGKELKDGGCSRTTPRCPVKTEPSTPCQVPEVTTSSKTDISGNNNGGIPVGIAIARQRVQQNAPSPLAVLTCQDRSPQLPTWPVAPPHWQFTPSANTLDQGVPIQQLVVRDPVTGQLMLLQSQGLDGGMPRAVVWPGNAPMQLMQAPPPQPQPVLLSDRLVTIAPQVPDKRRQIHDPVSGVMFPCEVTKNAPGQGGSGLLIQPTLTPQQFSSVLIQQMPFAAHHNNALLLSTQVAEHSLINQNLVISNHLENTVINPQIIGMESPNFGPQGGLMQHMHPSLVISHHHTETNFMRQDITPVLPLESPIIVKQEIKTECSESSPKSEDLKYEEETQVQDASNQTETEPKIKEETPVEIKSVKEEKAEKTITPDLSGLELLSNSIAEHEKFQAEPEPEPEEKVEPEKLPSPEPKNEKHFGGLGFLCEVAANHGFFNAFAEDPHHRPSSPSQPLNLSPHRDRSPETKKEEKFPIPDISKGTNLQIEVKEKPASPVPPPIVSPEIKLPTEPKLLPIKKIAVAKLINEQISPEISEPLKKRPGRPKKAIKFDDELSGEDDSKKEEPPVLEPWSALPKQKSSPLPPTLTPHKKRKSFESVEENDSMNYPPPLSPPSLIIAPHKKKLLKLLQKQMSEEISHSNIEMPNRIRPKLKAEAKVKVYNDDDDLEDITPVVKETKTPLPLWKVETKKEKTSEKKKEKPKLKIEESIPPEPAKSCLIAPDCKLNEEHLVKLPCNILMAQEGLFYTGQVTESKAEGIFDVILERERHRKPHIMCSEEITNNAVLEVKCDGYNLPSGTRLCAYWSQQYNCLYPGRASTHCKTDDKFVNVEFDDGDNGKINRDDIRLLPSDYPMVECDPNPLSSLGKRKRLSSTSADTSGKSLEPVESPAKEEKAKPPKKKKKRSDKERPEKMDEDDKNFPSIISSIVEDFFQSEHERKRIKKEKKRLVLEGRALKHKHRDACKVHHKRKHKHHRKHKHKHSIDKETVAVVEEEKETVLSEQEEDTEDLPALNSPKNSKSKIAAFLPERHEMWVWKGDGVKRGRSLGPRGKGKKTFYKAIQRGNDIISVGDCAVFVSTGRPDRPFIGKIESLWATTKNSMAVKVSWFYHPEEAIGAPEKLNYPGGLFESPHNDCNDVQTISHKCEVVPLSDFLKRVAEDPSFLDDVYENQEIYYLAGHYDPHNENITFEPGVHQ